MTSVLFITSTPDQRASTANLDVIIEEVLRRPGCRAELWYLRCFPEHRPRPGSRTVDRLRTWLPCRILDAAGLGTAAAGIRGIRLRRWLRRTAPDIVVLDDGLGSRVIEGWRPRPRLVVRLNDGEPEHRHLEPDPLRSADLVIVPAGSDQSNCAVAGPTTDEYPFHWSPAKRILSENGRHERRTELGLPTDRVLVVGWGDDGWLDGPDLFIRTLWALEHRHAIPAHGAWFGFDSDRLELDRLRAEARRCGIEGRFHFRPNRSLDDRFCGDAVLLPYRSTAGTVPAVTAALSGAVTVVFEAAEVHHPMVRRVRDLDVEAAARALADGLRQPGPPRDDLARRFDPAALVDDILGTVAEARR